MTEKRFIYDFDTGFVSDNKTGYSYEMFNHNDGADITKLLNALHEENEQLTKEIEDLKEERDFYKGHCESEGLLYD